MHIKAFSNSANRPTEGDIITCELATDESGRFFAKNIRLAVRAATSNNTNQSSLLGTSFIILFSLLFALSTLLGLLPLATVGLYLTASIVTFIAYAIDKSAAQNDLWRTKESTLHLLSLSGGWPGAFLAQKSLRHKSKKQGFKTVFWVTVMTNCFTLGWLLVTKSGSNFLRFILGQVA